MMKGETGNCQYETEAFEIEYLVLNDNFTDTRHWLSYRIYVLSLWFTHKVNKCLNENYLDFCCQINADDEMKISIIYT